MYKLLLNILVLLGLFSCDPPRPIDPPVVPPEPENIVLSQSSFEVAASGENLSLTIEAPVRPKWSSDQKWVSFTDGTYNEFKITIGLKVAANDSYEERRATVTIVSGTLSASVTIKQAAATRPVDPIEPEKPENNGNTAWQMASKLGFGWNMGNQMEAYNNFVATEGIWTNTLATKATFAGVKAKGVKSVRIPISWMNHIGAAPDYKLDDRLDRIVELVGWAKEAGLNVIINIHHDDKQWIDVKKASINEAYKKEVGSKVAALWSQLANKFKDEGDYLIFESFNEINDGEWGWSADYRSPEGKKRQNDVIHYWNQVFVDAVRSVGGENSTRWLGVPGYAASPEFALESLELPNDTAGKIMVSVHYYSPYRFCQTGEHTQWGHTRKIELADPSYNESYMLDIFSQLYNKWIKNGIPVYIGEFGCVNHSAGKARDFQMYWYEYFAKCAKTYGMSAFIWDNAASGQTPSVGQEAFGYIDHGTGEFIGYANDVFKIIRKAFENESPTYTLKSIYNSAPKP